ncbi:MAG TPA: RtcB family protein [Thermoanaerobaculales bacterium]|nr:RtcB family protein [Thermoanaerobaculales bacterium]HQL30156.1 RtcB family protein [Thermoanaerobaculales bacterium]
MVDLKDLRRISDHEWEIPTSVRADMRVPVRVFASRALLEAIGGESSLEQAVNAATLPGVVGRVLVMPDVHQGYGFPIGGVAATELPHGLISPGAIGYDINCGVRLLASNVRFADVEGAIGDLASALDAACPSGVGTGGRLKLDDRELERVCREGGEWARRRGYGTESDVARTEGGGVLAGADFAKVGRRARDRGRTQVGTLGAGNHFIEVEVVDEVFDVDAARAMGLEEGFLTVLIHCGSRGFGHQVCTDYVKSFQGAVERYHIRLPDRELVCAPNDSPEGQDYLAAMRCAANYAFANRQVLAHHARGAFTEALRGRTREPHLHQVYDIAHNMGKTEEHAFDGVRRRVCVHRKGATRAFGPGFPDLPPEYRAIGQPVLVPGSMGTASWVLAGTEGSSERSLASCCHGAGRTMSRSRAKRTIHGGALRKELEERGIRVRAGSMPGLAEEAPAAYKDVDAVVDAVVAAGIARKVARLRPVAVVKG